LGTVNTWFDLRVKKWQVKWAAEKGVVTIFVLSELSEYWFIKLQRRLSEVQLNRIKYNCKLLLYVTLVKNEVYQVWTELHVVSLRFASYLMVSELRIILHKNLCSITKIYSNTINIRVYASNILLMSETEWCNWKCFGFSRCENSFKNYTFLPGLGWPPFNSVVPDVF
jgi:hypothetical protein